MVAILVTELPMRETIVDTDVLTTSSWSTFPNILVTTRIPRSTTSFKAHETVIADFHRKGWHQIAKPVLVLFALVMKLPEN
ncbi:hypothetical protein J008_06136 [Cryptococcus neoformans]|nr:hypothetical protein J008_06136 [Cryptococcus neoformans var. grubii]